VAAVSLIIVQLSATASMVCWWHAVGFDCRQACTFTVHACLPLHNQNKCPSVNVN